MADAELRARATLEGGEETARGLTEIGEAQKGVSAEGQKGAQVTEQATEATDKMRSSMEDVNSLLSRIHPALGAFGDALFKGSKMAGDLASANIDLNAVQQKGLSVIRENAKALTLIGAGGAVALGIWAIVKAYQALSAEAERNEDIIKKNREEVTRQKEELAALAEAYERAANARRAFEAVGVAEKETGTGRAKRIAERYGVPEELAATVGGELEGVDVDLEMQALYTLLRQAGRAEALDTGMPGAVRKSAVEAQVKREREFLDARLKALAEERRRFEQQVQRESRESMGTTEGLERFGREQFPDLPEEDIAQLAEWVQAFGGSLEEFRTRVETRATRSLWDAWRGTRSVRTMDPGVLGDKRATLTALDEARLDRFLNAVEQLGKNGTGNVFHNAHVTVTGSPDDVVTNGRFSGWDEE